MSVINPAPTEKEIAHEGFIRTIVVLTLSAFYGGWILMLLLGFVGHQWDDPRWFVAYWTCVPVALGLRVLHSVLTRSMRKYARPQAPTVRR